MDRLDTKNASAIGVLAILAVAGVVGYLFIPTTVDSGWPEESFSSSEWKSRPPNTRYRLTKSLIRSNALTGKTSNEVEALLGQPEYRSTDGRYWTYVVQNRATGVGGFNANAALNVDFDDSGIVSRAYLRLD